MLKVKKGMKVLMTEGAGVFLRKVWKKGCGYLDIWRAKKNIRGIHVITGKQRNWQKQYAFKKNIKFSIITPLYNTPKRYLNELIDSLERQTYPNWELCLADGSDADHSYVRKICHRWSKKDSRIVYKKLKENRGISQNTNACIKMSSGQYFGLLDHDDVLHESALFEMMLQISKKDADFLYSDEAKFSGKVEDAVEFNFKPGFGKDELRSHNYICHFTVFSRELLEKSGGKFYSEFDGSQDHDMVLRLTEKANKIVHISKVLYYWRVHSGSVSMNLDSKIYAVDAAIRAVNEQLNRTQEYGSVASSPPYRTLYRVKYEISIKSRVCILVYNLESDKQYEDLAKKIMEVTDYSNIEIGSLMKHEYQYLGRKLNESIKQKKLADYIVFMDANCIPLNSGWIEEMLMYAQRQDVAVVSPKVLYQNDTIAYAGIALDRGEKGKIRFLGQGIPNSEQGYEAILRHVRNTTAGWMGCFMVKKERFLELGGFSESIIGYEDIDFSLKAIDKGYLNVWTCFAEICYLKDAIESYENDSTERFIEKWKSKIMKEDPYYNKNWRLLRLV